MTTPRLLSDRAPYQAMPDRPPLKMPDGKRMVVWIIVNVEHWSIERAMPRTVLPPPMGQPLLPDWPFAKRLTAFATSRANHREAGKAPA